MADTGTWLADHRQPINPEEHGISSGVHPNVAGANQSAHPNPYGTDPNPNPYGTEASYPEIKNPVSPIGGGPERNPITGEARNEEARQEDIASDIHSTSKAEGRAGKNYNESHENPTKEGRAMAENSAVADLADEGNRYANSTVRDTDAVVADARHDPKGTEYTENSSGGLSPDYASMAKVGKPVPGVKTQPR